MCVVRPNHLGPCNAIAVGLATRSQCNFIMFLDISQRPEECIAVPGNRHIPGLCGQRRARNMSNRPLKRRRIDPFKNDCRETNTRNFEQAQRRACSCNLVRYKRSWSGC